MQLTKKEIDILMHAFIYYNCLGCEHHGDVEVCSCDKLYDKLKKMKESAE